MTGLRPVGSGVPLSTELHTTVDSDMSTDRGGSRTTPSMPRNRTRRTASTAWRGHVLEMPTVWMRGNSCSSCRGSSEEAPDEGFVKAGCLAQLPDREPLPVGADEHGHEGDVLVSGSFQVAAVERFAVRDRGHSDGVACCRTDVVLSRHASQTTAIGRRPPWSGRSVLAQSLAAPWCSSSAVRGCGEPVWSTPGRLPPAALTLHLGVLAVQHLDLHNMWTSPRSDRGAGGPYGRRQLREGDGAPRGAGCTVLDGGRRALQTLRRWQRVRARPHEPTVAVAGDVRCPTTVCGAGAG
jgi:hypothetical protein